LPPLAAPDADTGDHDVSQLPAGGELENELGRCWLRQQPLVDLWPAGDHWLRSRLARLDSLGDQRPSSADMVALLHALPDDAVYLDLETCGFAGSMIFLIGLIHHRGEQLVLSQLLARNYAEEKVLLQALWSWVSDKSTLVTFNGKSFDWPMVLDRTILHRLSVTEVADSAADMAADVAGIAPRRWPFPATHCDLLHWGRRRWKDVLPNCKLQTLEKHICRRHRTEDIDGREIPAAYHDYVRTGDAWLMRSVLHHNVLDLITLLQLSIYLVSHPRR